MSIFDLDTILIREHGIASADEFQLALDDAIALSKKEHTEIKVSSEKLLSFSFDKLGNPLSLMVRNYHYEMLVNKFANKYEYIYQQALNFHAKSISAANTFLAICKSRGLIKPCDLLDTYIEKCCWGNLMVDYICLDKDLEENLDEEFPTEDDFDHLFTLALGCYLFNEVNDKLNRGQSVDLNLLGQAFSTTEYSHSTWSWGACDAHFSEKMSKNALKRLENDPIQLAKKEIEKSYEENKKQFKRHGFSAQFIREMHDKYPIITSIKTIENLVTSLNKKNEFISR